MFCWRRAYDVPNAEKPVSFHHVPWVYDRLVSMHAFVSLVRRLLVRLTNVASQYRVYVIGVLVVLIIVMVSHAYEERNTFVERSDGWHPRTLTVRGRDRHV